MRGAGETGCRVGDAGEAGGSAGALHALYMCTYHSYLRGSSVDCVSEYFSRLCLIQCSKGIKANQIIDQSMCICTWKCIRHLRRPGAGASAGASALSRYSYACLHFVYAFT